MDSRPDIRYKTLEKVLKKIFMTLDRVNISWIQTKSMIHSEQIEKLDFVKTFSPQKTLRNEKPWTGRKCTDHSFDKELFIENI